MVVVQVTKQNDMIQDLSIMKKGVDPSVKCVVMHFMNRFRVLIASILTDMQRTMTMMRLKWAASLLLLLLMMMMPMNLLT